MEQFNNEDEEFKEVVRMIIRENSASVAKIQRFFEYGYSKAARIVDKMEDLGFISESNSGVRKIIITPEKFEEYFGEKL